MTQKGALLHSKSVYPAGPAIEEGHFIVDIFNRNIQRSVFCCVFGNNMMKIGGDNIAWLV